MLKSDFSPGEIWLAMAKWAFFASGFLPRHSDKMKPPYFAWQKYFSPRRIALVLFFQLSGTARHLAHHCFARRDSSPWPSLWRRNLEQSGVGSPGEMTFAQILVFHSFLMSWHSIHAQMGRVRYKKRNREIITFLSAFP